MVQFFSAPKWNSKFPRIWASRVTAVVEIVSIRERGTTLKKHEFLTLMSFTIHGEQQESGMKVGVFASACGGRSRGQCIVGGLLSSDLST